MLDRIIEIFKRKKPAGPEFQPSQSIHPSSSTRSLHDVYRKKEQERIAKENENMANRMIHSLIY